MKYILKNGRQRYIIHDNGNIERTDLKNFNVSGQWTLLGLKPYWNSVRYIPWKQIKNRIDKGETVTGYVIDLDHGTTRQWGGQFNGKNHKATILQTSF